MTYDGHAADHVIRFPRPSSSIFAYFLLLKHYFPLLPLLLLLLVSMHEALCVDYCTMQAVMSMMSIIVGVLSVISSEVKF